MTGLFYDIQSYTKGDTHETAYKEGQREVIRHILRQLMRASNPDDNNVFDY